MVVDSTTNTSGHSLDGLWRLGHLEGGVFSNPKRLSRARRLRLHGPGGPKGYHHHLVWAWIVIVATAASGGAAAAALAILAGGAH